MRKIGTIRNGLKLAVAALSLGLLFSPRAYAQTTEREWQAVAMQKYPELGISGSLLNKRFVNLYNSRRQSTPQFFTNPQWPLLLADELAASSQPQPIPTATTPAPAAPDPTPAPAEPAGEPQKFEYEAPSLANGCGLISAKFRWWAPADTQVRGVIILLPGRGGDGRGMADNGAWQSLATNLQFGLLGCFLKNGDADPFTYQHNPDGKISDLLNDTLDAVLSQNKQTVKNPPLAFWGHSAGGNVTQQYASRHPGRMVAAVLMRATAGPGGLEPGKEDVPMMIFIGKNDKPEWVNGSLANYEKGRTQHALWTLAMHPNEGHEVGNTQALAHAHITAAVRLRLPEKPGSGDAGKPKKLTEQSGWLGDTSTLDAAAFNQFKGKKKDATWFLDESVAKVWQEYLRK